MISTPWILHDAELALWAAWKDGMPFQGPGGRGAREPLFHCKASLTITETFTEAAADGNSWIPGMRPRDSSFNIEVSFPDGSFADDFGRVLGRMNPGGWRILTVRIYSESAAEWTVHTFFYVAPSADSLGESGQVLNRSITLKAGWRQERVGGDSFPSLVPAVHGEIDWVCGPRRVTAMLYDPATETWSSTSQNDVGNGTRYVTLSPATEDPGADVILACYLPRLEESAGSGDTLDTLAVKWQNTFLMRVGNHASATHHGLELRSGHSLQSAGIAEPLATIPQDRMLDEPVLVFRYLRRIYATLGHGVLAVPRLLENTVPPASHDPAFRIAVPGAANPGTGQSGLVMLPNGAWLDGTVLTAP